MHPPTPASRQPALDALRGVAILQVLLWHYFAASGQMQVPVLKDVFNVMWSGVDLFFVLSGFLIGGILLDHRHSERFYSTFYGRRILRIVPLYALLLVLVLYDCGPAAGPMGSFVPYLTFTQNFTWARADQWGPTSTLVTWSLAVEEQFYLVLPVMIRFLPQRWLPWACAILVGCAPLARWLCANLIYDNATSTYVLMPCRMDGLFLGVLVAWAVRQPVLFGIIRRYRAVLVALAALLGFILLRFSQRGHSYPLNPPMRDVGLLCVAFFYATILLWLASAPKLKVPVLARPLCWIGLGAYSIYLFHLPILQFLQQTVHSQWQADAAAASLTALIAVLAWFWVERPAIGLGHRAFAYDRRSTA